MGVEFKDRLKEIRELRQLTQAELSRKAGLPATSVSHFEAGSRKPSFDNLKRLSAQLAVSTDYLMGITDSPDANAAATRIARHLGSATDQELDFLESVAKSLADKRSENG